MPCINVHCHNIEIHTHSLFASRNFADDVHRDVMKRRDSPRDEIMIMTFSSLYGIVPRAPYILDIPPHHKTHSRKHNV